MTNNHKMCAPGNKRSMNATYNAVTGNHPSGHNDRMYHALTVQNVLHRSNHARAIDKTHSHQGNHWHRLRRRERQTVEGLHLRNPQAYIRPEPISATPSPRFIFHAADQAIGGIESKHHVVKRDALF